MTTSRYLHPGALLDELLDVYAMSLSECAARSGLSADTLQSLRNGQCDIDAGMDRRLAQCFAYSAGLWLDWQAFYEAGATHRAIVCGATGSRADRDATAGDA